MTYFNLINPFTLTPSLSFLLIWAIKICVFYPLFFLGTYKHLQSRRLPLCLYLIIAVGAFFLPFNFFINDLIWIVIAIALIYFLVNHSTCSLTDLVASFSYSMLVYYFSQVIVVSLLPLLLQLLASNCLLRPDQPYHPAVLWGFSDPNPSYPFLLQALPDLPAKQPPDR